MARLISLTIALSSCAEYTLHFQFRFHLLPAPFYLLSRWLPWTIQVLVDHSGAGKAKKQVNFTNFEIEQLARSWVACNRCSAVGTNQSRAEYWGKIVDHFSKAMVELQKKFPATVRIIPRSLRSLGSKWSDINHDCAKFSGALSTIQALNESGTTLEEQMEKARELYKQTNKKGLEFTFEGAWNILKDSIKWQTFAKLNEKVAERATKRKQRQNVAQADTQPDGEQGDDSPVRESATPEMVFERPIGNKKAKELAAIEKRLVKNKGNLADSHAMIAAALEHRAAAMDTAAEIALFQLDLDSLDEDAKEFMMEKRSVAKAALALKKKSLIPPSDDQENQAPSISRPCSINSLNRLNPTINLDDISDGCLPEDQQEEEWDNSQGGGYEEERHQNSQEWDNSQGEGTHMELQREEQQSTLRDLDMNSLMHFL